MTHLSFADACAMFKTLPCARDKIKSILHKFTSSQLSSLYYDWKFWARANQLPPDGDWRFWVLLAGRGFGKTRTGAEWVRAQVNTKQSKRIALIGPTAADVRDVMIEGESGIIETSPPWMRPIYTSSKRKLEWPNGALAFAYSADEPDRLRGPQHDALWADELASWRYPAAWDMALMGLRLGDNPRAVITTTPRPTSLIKELMTDPLAHVTRGSTFDNSKNLPATFLQGILRKYQGTTLGAQEIYAEIIEEVPGVLWQQSLIDSTRLSEPLECYDRVVVAIDPAVSTTGQSDETGIIVVARKGDQGYVLDDLSGHFKPQDWAARVQLACRDHGAAYVVAEINQGGDLIESVLKLSATDMRVKKVRALKGKAVRAEPIAALYAQGRIHHVGRFNRLEDQMCTCDLTDPASSPDRVDALVWGFTDLFLNEREGEARMTIL